MRLNPTTMKSLSARRAWIEIQVRPIIVTSRPVALRKESVDRNNAKIPENGLGPVALRKESVDRNIIHMRGSFPSGCRSPQGERG